MPVEAQLARGTGHNAKVVSKAKKMPRSDLYRRIPMGQVRIHATELFVKRKRPLRTPADHTNNAPVWVVHRVHGVVVKAVYKTPFGIRSMLRNVFDKGPVVQRINGVIICRRCQTNDTVYGGPGRDTRPVVRFRHSAHGVRFSCHTPASTSTSVAAGRP